MCGPAEHGKCERLSFAAKLNTTKMLENMTVKDGKRHEGNCMHRRGEEAL